MTEAEEYTPLAFDPSNPDHVEIIQRVIPDMRAIEGCHNPYSRVRFREGLLVMRELIIAELEPHYSNRRVPRDLFLGELKAIISNVWPIDWCGNDPGTPRRLAFHEIAKATAWLTQEEADQLNAQAQQEAREEGESPHVYKAGDESAWESIDYDASTEALPSAYALLCNMGVLK